MEVTKVEQYLELLAQSGVLSPEQMQVAKSLAAQSENAEALARALIRQQLLTRWQAGQLLIGRASFMMGKYRLIDLLGRGGMGAVFLAEHTAMGRRVAIKLVPKGLATKPGAMERFLAEARATATLDHPNIVHAYSIDTEGDRWYLVMEYVDGWDLQRVVEAEGQLSYARAADYIRQGAEGLAHAHNRGMIHCDIKPSNLLLNKQGAIKILDLGLARLANAEDSDASNKPDAQHALGTVDYLAPEQAMNAETFDRRADIYSLGCTLYFLLTGHAPFPEGTLAERIVKHQTMEPASVFDARPDAPRDLVRICRKMMAKDPNQRYQSMDEVILELAQWKPTENEIKQAVSLDDEMAQAAAQAIAEPAAPVPETPPTPSLMAKVRERVREDPKRAILASGFSAAVLVVMLLISALLITKLWPTRPAKSGKPVAAKADSTHERWGGLKGDSEGQPSGAAKPGGKS